MTYREAIVNAMGWLGEQPDTIFVGQTVGSPGSYMYGSLEKVPAEKRIEMPVAEEMQMGITLGLALEGYRVVSVYPRMDFLLLALNQLVNHVDKIGVMSERRARPGKIIVRTSVGPREPLDGGVQHTQDYCEALARMLRHCAVVDAQELDPELILSMYVGAATVPSNPATVVVESGARY